MCVLQVFWHDNIHPDPEKDLFGSWKKGYILAIHEDTEVPESPSPQSKTIFVRLPLVAKADIEPYMTERKNINNELIQRRLFKLDSTLLAPNVLSDIATNRDVTLATARIANVKAVIRNLETGQLEG